MHVTWIERRDSVPEEQNLSPMIIQGESPYSINKGEFQAEERIKIADLVFSQTSEGIMVVDEDLNICFVNPAFTRITGYTREEALGYRPAILSSGHHDEDFYHEMWLEISESGKWKGEIWNRRKNGQIYPEWLSITAVRNKNGGDKRYVALFRDLTAKKHGEEATYLAYYDALTELPTRALLMERLNITLAQAHRTQRKLAVVVLSVDRFKYVNNTLGHQVGDQLLKEIARRLTSIFREDDTIARIGGAEFALVLTELNSLESISKLAHKLQERLKVPFWISGKELYATFSVGIAVFPSDGLEGEDLLNNADAAMYRAIEQGGDCTEMFTAQMNETVMERLALEHGLRRALARDEFELYYQPQIDVTSGAVVGAEALLRWRSPEFGLMSPNRFIPVAEETGLIVPIGEWVLRKGMEEAVKWGASGYGPLRIAINLSGRQFRQEHLVKKIDELLMETGLDSHQLELEITESVAMFDVEFTVSILQDLKRRGIHIAIDDFGTGYSSLNYLQKFPINTLKIDSTFLSEKMNNEDTAIITAILHLAQTLNYKAVAEGVETWEQYEFLKSQRCDEVQGYLFSRPVPADEFCSLLSAQKAAFKSSNSDQFIM